MVVPAGSTKSYPPPPPLAALRGRAPQLAAESELALVPQWEEIPDPMRPAPKRGLGSLWWKLGTGTLAAGAFVAAGYFGAMAHLSMHQPKLLQLSAAEVARPIAKAQPAVLTSTAPAAMRDTPNDAPLATPVPSSAPAPIIAEAIKPAPTTAESKRSTGKSGRGTSKIARGKRLKVADQPIPAEPSDAAETDAQDDSEKLARATKKEPAPSLPEQPSRNEVQAGIEQIRPALNTCAAGAHGTVFANLTIQGSGRVSYSAVEGEFTSGSVGSCMARALRSASFPQFSGPSLKVRYPFVF